MEMSDETTKFFGLFANDSYLETTKVIKDLAFCNQEWSLPMSKWGQWVIFTNMGDRLGKPTVEHEKKEEK